MRIAKSHHDAIGSEVKVNTFVSAISVIIPVHNGGDSFRRCLEALNHSTLAFDTLDKPNTPIEVIIVDDASTETLPPTTLDRVRTLTLTGAPRGPAFARNVGAAAAHGNILVFIDADVAVHPDTLSKIARYFEDHADVSALFGSYDDAPAARTWVSLYKNLQHHYVHQHASREAATFWAGCGAIRREAFVQIGGFSEAYARPSIEDIELGVRLKQAGGRIWLCRDVLVTHLKRWTLASLLRADIFGRAVPWTRLILASGQLPADLNLNASNRISALAALSVLPLCALGLWWPGAWLVLLAVLVLIVVLNAGLYALFVRRGGLGFAIAAFGLHLLYFHYSTLVFGTLSAASFVERASRRRPRIA